MTKGMNFDSLGFVEQKPPSFDDIGFVDDTYAKINTALSQGVQPEDLIKQGYTYDQLVEAAQHNIDDMKNQIDNQTVANEQTFANLGYTEPQTKTPLQAKAVKRGFPALGESVKEGVYGIPGGVGNFLLNTAKDLGTTGKNLFTHWDSLPSIGNVAGHEIASLPTNLLNAAINTPVAVYDKFAGKPYKPVANIPNITDLFANDKVKQQRENQAQLYPSAKLLGDIVALKPLFGKGALANTAKASGLGFFGSNSDLTNRITDAGTGATLVQIPEAIGGVYKKTAPFIGNKFAGISNNSYNRGLNAVSENRSIFGKDFNKAKNAVGSTAKNLSNQGTLLYDPLVNSINETVNSASTGGGINPVAEAINPKLADIQRWIDESAINQMANNSGGVNPADVHDIKSRIGEWTKFADEPNSPVDYKGKPNELLKRLYGNLNSKLGEISPEYKLANENFQDVMAAQEFNPLLKFEGSPWGWARLAGPLFGSLYNPAFLGAELLSSPIAHQMALRMYGSGANTSPAIGQSALYQSNNK